MEHSTAIMEDAGKAIDGDTKSTKAESAGQQGSSNTHDNDRQTNNFNRRKRKADFHDSSMHHGSRGGRGGRNNGKRHQKGDMGRGEYLYASLHSLAISIPPLTLTQVAMR